MVYTKEQIDLLDKYIEYAQHVKKLFNNGNNSMKKTNHQEHDDDPNYWNILLKDIKETPEQWKDKLALDFACGCGRNIRNLLNTADFKRVDGCDVSHLNAEFSQEYIDSLFGPNKCIAWENDGITLHPAKDNTYDFVMTCQALSHISVYDIRLMLLKEMHRVLKPGGLLSIHFMNRMPFTPSFQSGPDRNHVPYHANSSMPSGLRNMSIDNPDEVVNDLKKIGLRNITYVITGVGTEYDYTPRPEYWFRGIK